MSPMNPDAVRWWWEVEFQKKQKPATNVPIKPPSKKKKEALNQKLLPGKLDNLAEREGQKI